VHEFSAKAVFPFAADAILERDATCRQLSDFLRLSAAFAHAAQALEADGVGAEDLVLLPFATERDLFGAALWLQRLPQGRRPALAFVFYNPDLQWQVSEDRHHVTGDFSFFRYAVKRLRTVLPAGRILLFAADGRLRGLLERITRHPCTQIPLATHYFPE